jgi:3-oxoacyl-[acyl-carrier protein] reductase
MSDFLLRVSTNKASRKIIQTLRLPIPLPPVLSRAQGPWEERFLAGKTVFIGLGPECALAEGVTNAVEGAGGRIWVQGKSAEPPAVVRPHALVYDATGLDTPEQLRDVYEFFHAHVRRLSGCGRVVIIARPPAESDNPLCRAARRALEGFVRSLGKEIGRKGSTAQVLHVDSGAEERLEPVLRFLLSRSAAYISGQAVHVSGLVFPPASRAYVKPLAEKVALVTGGARGIGEATSRVLAREGARVIVMDRESEIAAATRVAQAIQGTALALDITDARAAEIIMEHVREHYDGLDIVVHNAGVTRDKTLGNMSEEKWDMVLGVNLLGLVRSNEQLLDSIRDGGRIIALSSVGGIAGNAGQTNYAATKAGLIGYVQALAPKAASRGITVNAVAPGFIETKMTAAMPLGTREAARRLSSLMQGGLPEDIAEAITFLASPGAAGLTGEVLRVCGGNFVGA